MRENLWRPSQSAESNPRFSELVDTVQQKMQNGDFDRIETDYYYRKFETTDEAIEDIVVELQETPGLTAADHRSLARLLNTPSIEDLSWGYGTASDEGQLFNYDAPILRRTVEPMDIAVLAGVVGNDFIGKSKAIDKRVHQLAGTPHSSRVVLGTAALIATRNIDRRWEEDYARFENRRGDGLSSCVEVYADYHGDFRMRESRQADEIKDPFGHEQLGGPEIESTFVAGYHSVEPCILMNVLYHQAQRMDNTQLVEFVQTVTKRIYGDTSLEVKVGPYGDWGDNDGEYEARLLRELIQERDNSIISALTVIPQGRERLIIESTQDGVSLGNSTIDDEEGAHSISIGNDRLEEFVVSLIKSSHAHGRTSPATLLRILNALVEPALLTSNDLRLPNSRV